MVGDIIHFKLLTYTKTIIEINVFEDIIADPLSQVQGRLFYKIDLELSNKRIDEICEILNQVLNKLSGQKVKLESFYYFVSEEMNETISQKNLSNSKTVKELLEQELHTSISIDY